MKKFTVSEALAVGWAKTKQHFGFLVMVMLGSWFATLVVNYIAGSGQKNVAAGRGAIGAILSFIVSIFIQVGIIRITLKILDDVRGGWRDFLPSSRIFWNMVLGTVLYGLIVILGSVLGFAALVFGTWGAAKWAPHSSVLIMLPLIFLVALILAIPGMVLAIKYRFYSYLIVDKGLGAIPSLKESGRLTAGEKLNLFWFMLASGGIVLLGVIALVIGLLWAVPTAAIAFAYIYRKLSAGAPAVAAANPQ